MNITLLKQGSLNGLRRQTNECLKNAYNKGYEDGNKIADKDMKEIQDSTYDVAYNTAINDYNKTIQQLHECKTDFISFLAEVYSCDLSKEATTTGSILYEIIPRWDMREVIDKFKKWQEQKKQAEEFKVGDIVKFNKKCHGYETKKNREFLVLHKFDNGIVTLLYDNGDTGAVDISLVDKTGRHIDVTEQLLDKLKGDN